MSAYVSETSEIKTLVYIGGARCELGRVRAFIRRVREAGYEVTHDWTAFAYEAENSREDFSATAAHEPPMLAETRFDAWSASIEGVGAADVCVFLAPREGLTRGMWLEMGACQALGGVPIYVGHDDDTIATSMCTVVADDDAAFAALEAA